MRDTATGCLDRRPRSLLRDVFGVHGVNSEGARERSVRSQLKRIRTQPFVRVACVTIQPPGSANAPYTNLQRDLDRANDTFEQSCGVWIYCSGTQVVTTGILGSNGQLDQTDCNAGGPLDILGIGDHEVSTEERLLFNIGRNLGANIVCYFLPGGSTNPNLGGCAAHPDNHRGFWVQFGSSRWMFAHELGHIVGNLSHRDSKSNLMWDTPGQITSTPPRITTLQCGDLPIPVPFPVDVGVKNDPDVELCAAD
ncbi:MAG: hypothetical protein ACRDO2_15105 [Nocardioidaceae bacterium]